MAEVVSWDMKCRATAFSVPTGTRAAKKLQGSVAPDSDYAKRVRTTITPNNRRENAARVEAMPMPMPKGGSCYKPFQRNSGRNIVMTGNSA